jgi:hypothetical protein
MRKDRKEYFKQYRLENKEKAKQYYLDNKDKVKELVKLLPITPLNSFLLKNWVNFSEGGAPYGRFLTEEALNFTNGSKNTVWLLDFGTVMDGSYFIFK